MDEFVIEKYIEISIGISIIGFFYLFRNIRN